MMELCEGFWKTLKNRQLIPAVLTVTAVLGCAKPPEDEAVSSATKYLYVASGACQAGNNTTFSATTASNIVYRVNVSNGHREDVIADYAGTSGDTPVGLLDFDADNILVLVERNYARRIEKIKRDGRDGARTSFYQDAGTTVLTSMAKAPNGSIFFSRTASVGQIDANGVVLNSTFVAANAGAAACGTANSKYSSIAVTDAGHLVYLNSANNANRVGIIRAGPTCLAGIDGPANSATAANNASASALVWIPGAKQVIASYAGTTTAANINSLYVYDVTEDATTASLSAGTVLYDTAGYSATYPYRLYAISALAYDADAKKLYVASANQVSTNIATSGNYIIERFDYDPAAKKITRDGSAPFYASGFDTKCISAMFVGK